MHARRQTVCSSQYVPVAGTAAATTGWAERKTLGAYTRRNRRTMITLGAHTQDWVATPPLPPLYYYTMYTTQEQKLFLNIYVCVKNAFLFICAPFSCFSSSSCCRNTRRGYQTYPPVPLHFGEGSELGSCWVYVSFKASTYQYSASNKLYS